MEIIKIASVAVVICILGAFLRQYKSEYCVALTVFGGILIFFMVLPYLSQLIAMFKNFADSVGIGREMLAPALKVIGIAYVTSYAAQICRDADEGALAAKLEMAGKVLMLAIAMPVAMAMFDAIERILP